MFETNQRQLSARLQMTIIFSLFCYLCQSSQTRFHPLSKDLQRLDNDLILVFAPSRTFCSMSFRLQSLSQLTSWFTNACFTLNVFNFVPPELSSSGHHPNPGRMSGEVLPDRRCQPHSTIFLRQRRSGQISYSVETFQQFRSIAVLR